MNVVLGVNIFGGLPSDHATKLMKRNLKEDHPAHLRAGVLDKVLWLVVGMTLVAVGWYFAEMFLLD
tara:strand:+ start:69 stop:266 length:198 start_codon:yes stop_codon:yes gene_type:complete